MTKAKTMSNIIKTWCNPRKCQQTNSIGLFFCTHMIHVKMTHNLSCSNVASFRVFLCSHLDLHPVSLLIYCGLCKYTCECISQFSLLFRNSTHINAVFLCGLKNFIDWCNITYIYMRQLFIQEHYDIINEI